MAIHDPKRKQDGQLEFSGGEDTGRSPTRIDRNQLALLVNGSCRGDFIGQRPALIQCDLQFESNQVKTGFEDGYFQRVYTYQHPGNDSTLLFSISGRIFELTLFPDFQLQERILPDANPTTRPFAWFEQVENSVVWQDGQSIPLIIGTGSVVRSDVSGIGGVIDGKPKRQVPTGRAMCYANGRLWVVLPDERSFVASDIVGGPTGPLYFTENQFLSSGGAFKVPSNLGPVRAVRAIANLDTSLGQGPVQFLTTDGVFGCNAPPDSATWKDLTYPINTVSLIRNGAMSDGGTVSVNSDIWYRSRDGIRPFQIARRDFGMWSNTPMSNEVSEHIGDDSENLLDRNSGVLFDNWLIETCQPQFDSTHGVYHLGLVALDFTPITSMRARESPAWDGMWTGRYFMALTTATVQGVERCFVVVLSTLGKIQMWELDPKKFFDQLYDGTKLRIKRVIHSPRFDFQNRLELKQLSAQDHWADEVRGTVDFSLYYRQDQSKCWVPWQAWQVCAKTERCSADALANGCVTDLNLKPQGRPRVSAQRPPDSCDTGTGAPSSIGYEFQTRLEITGACQLNAVRLIAHQVDEDVYGPCPPTTVTECTESVCCGPDNVVESVP